MTKKEESDLGWVHGDYSTSGIIPCAGSAKKLNNNKEMSRRKNEIVKRHTINVRNRE